MDESMKRIKEAKPRTKGTVLVYERDAEIAIFVLLEDHPTKFPGDGTLVLILCGQVFSHTAGMTRRMRGIVDIARELP